MVVSVRSPSMNQIVNAFRGNPGFICKHPLQLCVNSRVELVRQLVSEMENSKFKLTVLQLKINYVLHLALGL